MESTPHLRGFLTQPTRPLNTGHGGDSVFLHSPFHSVQLLLRIKQNHFYLTFHGTSHPSCQQHLGQGSNINTFLIKAALRQSVYYNRIQLAGNRIPLNHKHTMSCSASPWATTQTVQEPLFPMYSVHLFP